MFYDSKIIIVINIFIEGKIGCVLLILIYGLRVDNDLARIDGTFLLVLNGKICMTIIIKLTTIIMNDLWIILKFLMHECVHIDGILFERWRTLMIVHIICLLH